VFKAIFRQIGKLFKIIFVLVPSPLSVGRITTYLSCALKYNYQYSSRRKSLGSPHLSYNSSLHKALQKLHMLYKDLSALGGEEIEAILKSGEIWDRKGYVYASQEAEFYKRAVEKLKNYVEKNRDFRHKITATEMPLTGWFGRYYFSARYDRVEESADGRIDVFDYKTGRAYIDAEGLKTNLQAVVYYYLARKKWGKRFGNYYVYYLEKNEVVPVIPDERDLENAYKTINSAVKRMKMGDHTPHTSPLCSWCDFAEICPERKGLEDPRIYKRIREGKKLALSYSKFSLYKNCPRNYKRIYLDRISPKPKYFFSIGLTIHETMEDFYTYDGWRREPALKFLLRRYMENWHPVGYKDQKQEEEYFKMGLEWLKAWYPLFAKGKWKRAYKVEPYFEMPLSGPKIGRGHVMVGFIDRIEENADGSFSIYDYKTDPILRTQEEMDQDLQLTIYYWLATAGWKIRDVSLEFFRFNKRLTTTRTGEDVIRMLRLVDELGFEMMEKEKKLEGLSTEEADKLYPPSVNKYCGGCDHFDTCPLKEEILKLSKEKVMNLSEDLLPREEKIFYEDEYNEEGGGGTKK